MITRKLKEKVIQEATKLKTCATKEELKRLDFRTFAPDKKQYCIYGQLTGNCFSDRALELLNCCAIPYSCRITSYQRTRAKFNENNRKNNDSDNWVFSAIEYYICRNGARNSNLLSFLKGKRKTLTLEDL